MKNLWWIFDQHTPGNVRVGGAPDHRNTALALASAGVEGVIACAKCHYGFSYYPTKVGTPHPNLQSDVFGGLLHAVRDQGMQCAAYISFGIDGAGSEVNPDWRRVYADGSHDAPGWFVNVCPFGSYVADRLLPQVSELVSEYRPDGFWFDTMGALSPCYCKACREAYENEVGRKLNQDEPDAETGQWRYARAMRLLGKIGHFIRDLDGSALVGFNQVGSLPYPEGLPESVSVVTMDPETPGPQTLRVSLNAAFGSGCGRRCEVMPTIFQGGWGDWAPADPLRIQTAAVSCWSRDVVLVAGDRLHPEGRLAAPSLPALQGIREILARWTSGAPDSAARVIADIGILHSSSLTAGIGMSQFALDDPRVRLLPVTGLHQLLVDAGYAATVVTGERLDGVLPSLRMVVVPEIPALTASVQRLLLDFCQAGGRVLFLGGIPVVAGEPFAETGVRIREDVCLDHGYLTAQDGDEVLFRGQIPRVEAIDAVVGQTWIPAFDALPGIRYGWGIGPSSGAVSDLPAWTRRTLGAGSIEFLGAPLGSDYGRNGNRVQAEWFGGFLRASGMRARARICGSYGNAELVLLESESALWLYIIRHDAEQLVGDGRYWARSTKTPDEETEVEVEISEPFRRDSLEVIAGEKVAESGNGPVRIRIRFKRPFCGLRVEKCDPANK